VSYYEEEPSVKAGFWFFWFRIYPKKEKKKKVKKAAGKGHRTKQEKKPEKKKKDKIGFDLIKNMISSGIRGLRIFFRHLVVKDLCLRIIVGDEDASACAIRYGRLCGIVGGSLATVKNFICVRERDISLSCDFNRKTSEYEASVTAKIRVCFVLEAALSVFFHFLINSIKKQS